MSLTFEPIADAMDSFGRLTFTAAGIGYAVAVGRYVYERTYQDLTDDFSGWGL